MRTLLLINAVAMFAAGVVLFIAPNAIAGAVGLHLAPAGYLFANLLGAAEFGLAVLCFLGMSIEDATALRAIAITCLVLHAMSGVAGAIALVHALTPVIAGNVLIRIVMVALFAYFMPPRPTPR